MRPRVVPTRPSRPSFEYNTSRIIYLAAFRVRIAMQYTAYNSVFSLGLFKRVVTLCGLSHCPSPGCSTDACGAHDFVYRGSVATVLAVDIDNVSATYSDASASASAAGRLTRRLQPSRFSHKHSNSRKLKQIDMIRVLHCFLEPSAVVTDLLV